MFCFRRIFRVNEDPKELITKLGLAAFKKFIGKPWLNHSNLIQSKFGSYVEYVVRVLGHGHHGHAMSCHVMPCHAILENKAIKRRITITIIAIITIVTKPRDIPCNLTMGAPLVAKPTRRAQKPQRIG